ncbi:MAG TPA: hypothetical protein VMM76_01950 [Pirellulaceae bacterium]|nr:hypothetical protein [Pirellulaceae bacterium]
MKQLFLTLPLIVTFAIPAAATDGITVRIGSGSVEIAKDGPEAERFRALGTRGGGILLICKRMQLQRDPTSYVVNCCDVTFITAAGLEGIAAEARFDLLNNRVFLTGGKDRPVQLIRDADLDSDITRLTADKVEMRLTPLRVPRDNNETNEQSHAPETSAGPVLDGTYSAPAR